MGFTVYGYTMELAILGIFANDLSMDTPWISMDMQDGFVLKYNWALYQPSVYICMYVYIHINLGFTPCFFSDFFLYSMVFLDHPGYFMGIAIFSDSRVGRLKRVQLGR